MASEREERRPDVMALVEARFERSTTVPDTFFTLEAPRIAEACWAMARRFHQGGRLLAFGNGAWATDAQHISVEFVHPVIVGKRALPALALTNDSATISGLTAGGDTTMPFARQVAVLARPQDIAMGLSPDGCCANVVAALHAARQKGLLTLGLAGGDGGLLRGAELDFCFVVPARDPLVIQETHETLYHVLWELVHVFFEHEGLLQ
ncbi:MAG TPA: SIS domain-containing protein [Ktedonobacteraceae bacterium]|jgi:D-sedoheptulose 7-phosphate isomerase|nr:SIS domain-containing protein [Ktedonobacteraceae bacterium]